MSEFLEFFNIRELHSGEASIVVVQSAILAMVLSVITAVFSFRSGLQKRVASFFWLGAFSVAYALWNLLFIIAYSQRDLTLPTTTVTVEFAERAHIVMGMILPYIGHQFLSVFFQQRRFLPRLLVMALAALLVCSFLPTGLYYGFVLLASGVFIFGSFFLLTWKLYNLYRTTTDLKRKTRALFILVGLLACTAFSAIGQIRAENLLHEIPLPYVGNILTAVFLYFIYQMVLNPRLREVRELMLRGIRILLLTLLLSIIFLALLAWVGENDPELFILNTFIASFIIMIILEPLRKNLDVFFMKQFIVDRYEFEELLKRLSRKIRAARHLDELTTSLLTGVRESGRVYQTALFLWDAATKDYRLLSQSNLTFKNTLPSDHAWVLHFRAHRSPLVMEQDHDLPEEVAGELRDMHSHLVLPLFRQDELLGMWALRSSLRSTNPYTSFSNEEIDLLEQLSLELVSLLDQLQHFEIQDRQERLAALGEMSAAVAHEIRNPLGAIQGAAQLLQTSPTLKDGEDKECVTILSKEIDRMQQTVNQYLSFARKTEEPVSVEIENLVKAVVKEVEAKARKTKTELHSEMLDPIPELKTDPLKVEQVLLNLVQNACEAFAKNVWVKASMIRSEDRPQVQIDVVDDGPGITPKNLSNIFNPLFTTKKAGSGIGLAICKKIIESLAGQISVQSTLGKGTTFRIVLPLGGPRQSVHGVSVNTELTPPLP